MEASKARDVGKRTPRTMIISLLTEFASYSMEYEAG
jgi:hypothetical protein